MKYFVLGILIIFSANHIQAQKYWLLFSDKGSSEAMKEIDPLDLLSPAAFERRMQHQIPLDMTDFPVYRPYVQQLMDAGIEIHRASRWINAVSVSTDLDLNEIQAICPAVKDMHPVGHLVRAKIDAPVVAPRTMTTFNYGAAAGQAEMIGADCLHQRGHTGSGVTVAVFDSGFEKMDSLGAFDSLRTQNRLLHTYDFVDNDTGVFTEDNHGLLVSSCIVAEMPGSYVGTAPHVNLILAITEDVSQEVHQEEDNWLAAMEWADSLGVDVINSSLGYSTFDPGEGDYSYNDMNGDVTIITRAADLAAQKGILVVTSAGNEGGGNWFYLTAPCDGDSVLCVGAVDSNEGITFFSGRGPSSDGRIKPDVVALGLGSTVINGSNQISYSSGTSFSSPITAGLAACLVGAHPNRSNMDIITAIKESGDRSNFPDNEFGWGVPDGCRADSLLSVMDTTTSIPETLQGAFRVFPNPATDQLFIQNSRPEIQVESIEIIDQQGRRIIFFRPDNALSQTINVDVRDLSSGMYMIHLRTSTGQLQPIKFIRQ